MKKRTLLRRTDVLTDHTAELAELRQTNERLRRKIDFLFDRLGLTYTDQDVPLYVLHAQELIRAGQYGDALRVIREHTAVGIVESRAIVVDLSRRLGAPIPTEEQLGTSSHRAWSDNNASDTSFESTWVDDPTPSGWTLGSDGSFAAVSTKTVTAPVDSFAAWRD